MASVDIKNLNNEVVGQLELADAVFAGPVNLGLMHQAVKQYLASRRAGTHNTKTRAEVQRREETVAAEGHRPRAGWGNPKSVVA